MRIRASSRSTLRARARWTISERHGGLWVPVWEGHNLLTDHGLTNLAAGFGGTLAPPVYLVIDSKAGQIQNAGTLAAASTSVTLDQRVDEAGDTQINLGNGTANTEVVSFSAVTGSGPYVYTISATTKTHAQNDYCSRYPKQGDTIASIQSEVQYDSVAAPGKRVKSSGFFSSGTGNGTMQFFLTGSQALGWWQSLGTSENQSVGAGNLHNHLIIGYDHVSGNDVQVDISLTITN